MLAPSSDGCGTTVLHSASAVIRSFAVLAAALGGPFCSAARMFSPSSARSGWQAARLCGPTAAAAADVNDCISACSCAFAVALMAGASAPPVAAPWYNVPQVLTATRPMMFCVSVPACWSEPQDRC